MNKTLQSLARWLIVALYVGRAFSWLRTWWVNGTIPSILVTVAGITIHTICIIKY